MIIFEKGNQCLYLVMHKLKPKQNVGNQNGKLFKWIFFQFLLLSTHQLNTLRYCLISALSTNTCGAVLVVSPP